MCKPEEEFQYEFVIPKDEADIGEDGLQFAFLEKQDRSWFQFYGPDGFREAMIWAGIFADVSNEVRIMVTWKEVS